MRLGVHSAIVDGAIVTGDVVVEDGAVREVGVLPAGRTGLAAPGFIDIQVNGFGGVDFLTADFDGYRAAGEALAATGVTAYQPTIITAPADEMCSALEEVGKAQAEHRGPRILGAHLEGPFLSPQWKGAHDDGALRAPDLGIASRLYESGPISYMTIAPELPGGFELLDWLLDRDIVVALGHTDADVETAHAAFNRGARSLTHLYNAHRRFASRDPGVFAAAVVRPDVTIGLIPDFVHSAREAVLLALRAAPGRVALVTDAIAAAPATTGRFALGDREIIVGEDAARLPNGTLAGSILSLDRAVRNVMSLGIPLVEAIAAVTTVPATLLRHPELGSLRPRTAADIVVLGEDLRPVRTLVAGEEVFAA